MRSSRRTSSPPANWTQIVEDAFAYIGDRLSAGPTEYDVAEFIRNRFREEGLVVTDGPVVASNDHASDPHFEPTPHNAVQIRGGDWVLIDLWSRVDGEDSMFADITWTAYVGDRVPPGHQAVFDAVIGGQGRGCRRHRAKHSPRGACSTGWQVDAVAREHISAAGYADYFNHRLGHSLGREVHGNAVNLDGWETQGHETSDSRYCGHCRAGRLPADLRRPL